MQGEDESFHLLLLAARRCAKSVGLQEELRRAGAEMERHEGASQAYEAAYMKPFDVFAKGGNTGDWLAALDNFRNWLIREAA